MIYIQGDGGHAKVVRDIVERMSSGLRYDARARAVIAVGDNAARKLEAQRLEPTHEFLKGAFHPKAVIARDAVIGEGTVIMAGAVIGPAVVIGKHCIVNHGATVDHDCVVEDFAHIAPGAHLCGGVHVGEGALVGVGVGVAPGAKIPPWTLVKARSLEFEPIPGH